MVEATVVAPFHFSATAIAKSLVLEFPDAVAVPDGFDLFRREADAKFPIKHCDGCRRCPFIPHDLFESRRRFNVLWPRQTVRDHG